MTMSYLGEESSDGVFEINLCEEIGTELGYQWRQTLLMHEPLR